MARKELLVIVKSVVSVRKILLSELKMFFKMAVISQKSLRTFERDMIALFIVELEDNIKMLITLQATSYETMSTFRQSRRMENTSRVKRTIVIAFVT